ncbi:SMP-30/gluconolactonase/LRE family protein [Solirubrum puertoriconensis]|uniref:SMP-30/gluconolactonase/LRE family protein n=1 Tax=Solirubrum puertoriconensis TaxID=1751427 RepID=UPI001C1F4C69|nr:SMP-30/gluconolactonase/LRE family protein [Solirubrum puertoriconensis]
MLLCLYDQAIWSEGPVWWEQQQLLVWSDVEGRRVLAWQPDGSVGVLLDATMFTNGNAIDADGNLIHCEQGRRGISRTLADGLTVMIVTHYADKRLNSPNDLAVAPDGAIWFTDPTYGLTQPRQGCPAEPALDHRSVYRYDLVTHQLTRAADLEQPNGIAFSPDGHTLYVSDTSLKAGGHKHEIVAFTVEPDGRLGNPRTFATIEPGVPDGMFVDTRGWVWTSSGSGVQIFSAEGERLGEVPTPSLCSNCTLGGPSGNRLFITGEAHLWAIDLRS